MFCER